MTPMLSHSTPIPSRRVLWRPLKCLASTLLAIAIFPAAAQHSVYRCETNGKVSYSDAPCVGAKVIDATPTQGMDKMTEQSRKGRDVQREEFNAAFDIALRPLHGRSHADMDVMRRRVKLPRGDQAQCVSLDTRLPQLEADVAGASGEAKARADVDLYKARKRFFDLKC
jgi:hypothetical protein